MEEMKELSLEKTKVIALSATTEQHFRSEDDSKYFDGFLEKPVTRDRLKKLLV